MRDLFAKTFLDIIRANNALMQCRESSAFNAFSQKSLPGPARVRPDSARVRSLFTSESAWKRPRAALAKT